MSSNDCAFGQSSANHESEIIKSQNHKTTFFFFFVCFLEKKHTEIGRKLRRETKAYNKIK